MKWYVLHVLTGAELDVKRRLMEHGVTAVVIQETVTLRRGGQWHTEIRTLIPGYVFVHIELTEEIYYTIKRVSGILWLLPKGGPPVPLLQEDVATLLTYGMADTLPLSRVDFSGSDPRIVDGPLKDWEEYIVKLDRHRRLAHLLLPVLGEKKAATLYLDPL